MIFTALDSKKKEMCCLLPKCISRQWSLCCGTHAATNMWESPTASELWVHRHPHQLEMLCCKQRALHRLSPSLIFGRLWWRQKDPELASPQQSWAVHSCHWHLVGVLAQIDQHRRLASFEGVDHLRKLSVALQPVNLLSPQGVLEAGTARCYAELLTQPLLFSFNIGLVLSSQFRCENTPVKGKPRTVTCAAIGEEKKDVNFNAEIK